MARSVTRRSKRNKLIDFKETKRSSLKILNPSPEELFTRFVDQEEKLVFQTPIDRNSDIRVFSLLSLLDQLSAPLSVALGDIEVDSSFEESKKTLKNLRTKARLSLEEKGSNTLYLIFGFLEWRNTANEWMKSPLVLVPATLLSPALNAPYEIKRYEEEVVVNPTLDYYLKKEFGVELPDFHENEENLSEFISKIEEIANERGWKISTGVSLALASFRKISMYNDLQNNAERIKAHPILCALAEGISENSFQIPESVKNFDFDQVNPEDCYHVLSADSSQQDAIHYSKNNISFVMQGPPGTGKSQTIANIIAEALADEKRILFVSEKATALQVVLQRLEETNLSDFCLSLHNSEEKKRVVLDQLASSLNLSQPTVKEIAHSQLAQLSHCRHELNQYVKELHETMKPLSFSSYEAHGKLAELVSQPLLTASIKDILSLNQYNLHSLVNALQEYNLSLKNLGGQVKNNPWEGLGSRLVSYEFTEQMKGSLELQISCFGNITKILEEITSISPLSKEFFDTLVFDRLNSFLETVSIFANLPTAPECWIHTESERLLPDLLLTSKETHEKYSELESKKEELSQIFTDELEYFPYTDWKTELNGLIASLSELLFSQEDKSSVLFKNILEIENELESFADLFTKAEKNILNINNLLGTEYQSDMQSLEIFQPLLQEMQSEFQLEKQWFAQEKRNLISLVQQGMENTEKSASILKQLFATWDESILTLDFMPMNQRFKIEYDKEFYKNYTQYAIDKKDIQSYYKGAGSNLPDEKILAHLQSMEKLQADKKSLEDRLEAKRQGQAFIEQFTKKLEQEKQVMASIVENWQEEILETSNQALITRFHQDYDGVLKGFNKNYRNDKKELTALYRFRGKMENISETVALLQDYSKLKQWSEEKEEEFSQHSLVVEDYQKLSEKIKTEQMPLLGLWDKDFIEQDHSDLLNRFRLNYVGAFTKRFDAYTADLKTLKGFIREYQHEISQEEAQAVLRLLAEKQLNHKIFLENEETLIRLFPNQYEEGKTDWISLQKKLESVEKIKSLCPISIPEKMSLLLEADHRVACQNLMGWCQESLDSLKKMGDIAEKHKFTGLYFTAEQSDQIKKEKITSCCALSQEIVEKLQKFHSYCRSEMTNLPAIIEKLDAVEGFFALNGELQEGESSLSFQFYELYQRKDTKWAEIEELLENLQKIKSTGMFHSYQLFLLESSENKKKIHEISKKSSQNLMVVLKLGFGSRSSSPLTLISQIEHYKPCQKNLKLVCLN